MTEQRIRPFHSGTQSADWDDRNCLRCVKGGDYPVGITCAISHALTVAYFDDGTVSAEIANSMNYQKGQYSWKCGEFAPSDPQTEHQ